MSKNSLIEEVKGLLSQTDLDWEIVKGSNHYRVLISGRLVQVIPHRSKSRDNHRKDLNMRASIRRAIREHTK